MLPQTQPPSLIAPSEISNTTRLISITEITNRFTLHKTKIYDLIKAGELRPVKLGRKTLFVEAEINDWIADRIAASRKAA